MPETSGQDHRPDGLEAPDRWAASRVLDHLASGWRPWLLLILLALSVYLPGIATIPPVDRDEARYAQASRQMLESGDFVRIRFQDEARNKKPAGIYWLQAASVALLSSPASTEIWPYRLVSALGATLAVLLTFGLGARIFDRRTALVGSALLAISAGLTVEAHLATTDAVLLAAVVAAQSLLVLAYLGERRRESLTRIEALCFWLAEGVAILIKGPILPLLSLVTAAAILVADRRARFVGSLRPVWGVPLMLAIVLPWLVLIERATDGSFLAQSVGQDFAAKLGGAQEAHGAPPGYYLLMLPLTFWPASLFLVPLVAWAWRQRKLPATRGLIAWVVPFWVLLEIVPTKLPHYALPLFPALALGAARAVLALAEEGLAPPDMRALRANWGLWAALSAAAAAVLVVLPGIEHAWAWMVAALLPVATVMVAARAGLSQGVGQILAVIVAGLAVLVPGFSTLLPAADDLFVSRSAARLVELYRTPGQVVTSTGYAEPSLVFLLGTNTTLLPAEAAARLLATGGSGLALVEAREADTFKAALADDHRAVAALGEVTGTDYSNGRRVRLELYRLAPDDAAR